MPPAWWRGYWTQQLPGRPTNRAEMNLNMSVSGTTVSGEGNDELGTFRLSVRQSFFDSTQLALLMRYQPFAPPSLFGSVVLTMQHLAGGSDVDRNEYCQGVLRRAAPTPAESAPRQRCRIHRLLDGRPHLPWECLPAWCTPTHRPRHICTYSAGPSSCPNVLLIQLCALLGLFCYFMHNPAGWLRRRPR